MKTSAQELFLQANQCYAKKEFKKAENLYKKIPQKSAAIWYNMGNCAYKNGDDMHALLYWRRAQKMDASNIAKDSAYNSAIVAHKHSFQSNSPSLFSHLPILPLQILFFCAFSVFLVSNRKLWRSQRFVLLASLSILVMATGIITFASYRASNTMHALVMQDECALYAGPDSGYHEVCQLSQGAEVRVLAQQKNGWQKISCSGNTGWIQDSKIEII